MSDNKLIAIVVGGLMTMVTLCSIFGDGTIMDDESTKKLRETEKTKQLQIQYKIDSLKVVQKNSYGK